MCRSVLKSILLSIKLLFIFLNPVSIQASSRPDISSLVHNSQFEACRNHNFMWINDAKYQHLLSEKNFSDVMRKEWSCDSKSNRQIVSDSLKMEMDKIVFKNLASQLKSNLLSKAEAVNQETKKILECFKEEKIQDALCSEVVEKEKKSLKEQLQWARAFMSLGETPALDENPTGAFSSDIKWIRLKPKQEYPPLSTDEIKLANGVIRQNPQISKLQNDIGETNYQKNPKSAKHLSFHDAIPHEVQSISNSFKENYNDILSRNPVLKFLLPTSDPVQDYNLSRELLHRSFSKLFAEQAHALENLKRENEADLDICLYLNTPDWNEILNKNISADNSPNLSFCRISETLSQECKDKEQQQALTETGVSIASCVFTSPLVCTLTGAGLIGKDLIQKQYLHDRTQIEHSTKIQPYEEVQNQTDELHSALVQAPLAVAYHPSGRFLQQSKLKTILNSAGKIGFSSTKTLSSTLLRWSSEFPGASEGLTKIFRKTEENLQKLNGQRPNEEEIEEALDEAIKESVESSSHFKNQPEAERAKKVDAIKSCLSRIKGVK